MTEERGCTKAEAAAARAKAFELIEKYRIGWRDLHPIPEAPGAGELSQDFDPDKGRANEYWSTDRRDFHDAHGKEIFVPKAVAGAEAVRRLTRFVVSYAAVGCAIWAFAALYPDASAPGRSSRYNKKEVSKILKMARSRELEAWSEINAGKAREGLRTLPAIRGEQPDRIGKPLAVPKVTQLNNRSQELEEFR